MKQQPPIPLERPGLFRLDLSNPSRLNFKFATSNDVNGFMQGLRVAAPYRAVRFGARQDNAPITFSFGRQHLSFTQFTSWLAQAETQPDEVRAKVGNTTVSWQSGGPQASGPAVKIESASFYSNDFVPLVQALGDDRLGREMDDIEAILAASDLEIEPMMKPVGRILSI